MCKFKSIVLIAAVTALMLAPANVLGGTYCQVPDNGTGTATLPPIGCQFTSPDETFLIIDGLPPGTTIELDGTLENFVCCDGAYNCSLCSLFLNPGQCETAGGTLGGNGHCFAADLDMVVTGTGDLAGFSRHLVVPVFGEVHTGPRNPGAPVQTFPTDMFQLNGQLFGDPDFCEFIIIGGTNYGMPSQGQMTLTQLPSGDFAVDSFFDITYQIQFEGCPGSVLADYAGTTQATIRMETGAEPCGPLEDGSGCRDNGCMDPRQLCKPSSVNFDPVTGQVIVLECDCRNPDECYVNSSESHGYGCPAPDNGTGTITMPPMDCEFTSPDETFEIIEGLPPGTTIELNGTLKEFICCDGPDSCKLCSLSLAAGQCETTGGTLGGNGHCFEADLDMVVNGTGSLAGFDRQFVVKVFGEVHTGPRNPGDPVQTFPNEMFRLNGELFGDPDFCEFIITGGTDYGLPGPGQTTLTQLPSGDFAVDSFFDITYQIQFQGCPGSPLADYAGTTTATLRMQTGDEFILPGCSGGCPPCEICYETITPNPDGTFNIECECVPDADLNKDGVVDFKDFSIVADQWLDERP